MPMQTEQAPLTLQGFGLRYGSDVVLAQIDLQVRAGEVVALVGASGAGKTSLLHAVLGLSPAGACAEGGLWIHGVDRAQATEAEWARLRGRVLGLIPQDPLTALPAHRRVDGLLDEVLRRHQPTLDRRARRAAQARLLQQVGLDSALRQRYPHALSGGQGQRVLVALALAGDPAILIADEPTSALDAVAARALLGLLAQEAHARGRAVLLVSHDLAASAAVADRVAVLAAGRLVEVGPAAAVMCQPVHPYVQALVAARPPLLPPRPRRLALAPTAAPCAQPRHGCAFAATCVRADGRCVEQVPAWRTVAGRQVTCHHARVGA